VEKLTTVPERRDGRATENFTPENAPRMFPYEVGETDQRTLHGVGE